MKEEKGGGREIHDVLLKGNSLRNGYGPLFNDVTRKSIRQESAKRRSKTKRGGKAERR